jgi:plastocyanin
LLKFSALILVVGALLAVAVPAALATTGPGQRVNVTVLIDEKNGFRISDQAEMARGAIVTFQVYNNGKKAHNFTLLGKKTKTIKPRKWARFTVTLLTRGRFPFKSTLDKGKLGFSGFYTVY